MKTVIKDALATAKYEAEHLVMYVIPTYDRWLAAADRVSMAHRCYCSVLFLLDLSQPYIMPRLNSVNLRKLAAVAELAELADYENMVRHCYSDDGADAIELSQCVTSGAWRRGMTTY